MNQYYDTATQRIERRRHTPGPWHVDEGNHNVFGPSTHSGLLAEVHGHIHNGERQANAHLIAAAPELLEAAKAALEFVLQLPGDYRIVGVLEVAIAKAEGEQP